MRKAARFLLVVVSVLLLLPILGATGSATFSRRALARDQLTAHGELHYQWARGHLREPFSRYGALDDLGVRDFDVILLSNLATGLMNMAVLAPERHVELAELIEEVARRATSSAVAPSGARHRLGEHNLYASHLLLILALEHRVLALDGRAPSPQHTAMRHRLARHLRRASLSHPSAHARSYPSSPRWPADQSVTLEALSLYDHEEGTTLAALPTERWLAWLHTHETNGLTWSAVSGPSYAHIPRGCALSFMTSAMARFAPGESASLYRRYRAAHGIDWAGWRGFREWPTDHEGRSDVDAGPVLLGWGTAATGIGLGAARLHGDYEMAAGIERVADTVGIGVPRSGRYLLAPTLGQAMLFAGSTATPWDAPPEPCGSPNTGWPIGAGIAFTLTLFALVCLIPRIVPKSKKSHPLG
jgi:hypothetical protein